ncbi:MAG: ABC transporter ATP-binding protein [bacterium]|nr:ABC transporter ATP-binding protein [bacterium]
MSSLFVIRNLSKSYGPKPVLDDLSFEVEKGECFVILGRSGCGKSVTLRQLNGLEKPDSGAVFFDGTDIADLSEKDLVPIRQRVAMLFQGGALFDSMSVYENVAFPVREHTRLAEPEIRLRVRDKLSAVRLEGIEDRLPAALSGGMRKRVALARSLALNPEVVLFDEPTTGLDPMTSATIANLIQAARRSHDVTSIVVTHDLALTRAIADRLAFLENGRFRFLGTWADAESSSDSLLVRFLAGEEEDEDDS